MGWIVSNEFLELSIINWLVSQQHTNSDGLHGSTAAPIAVGGHNTDSVSHIVGYSDRNTCSTGGDWTEAWTDSDGVVDWSPTIILWGLPLHCDGHTVLTILLNSVGGSPGRRGKIWRRNLYDRSTGQTINEPHPPPHPPSKINNKGRATHCTGTCFGQ